VGKKPMPEIAFGFMVPGLVRNFDVFENDAGFPVFFRRIAPDVKIASAAAGFGAPRPLEPWMLVGGVVHDQFGDDPQAAPMGLAQEPIEIAQRAGTGGQYSAEN
jgi:hypothetical protein